MQIILIYPPNSQLISRMPLGLLTLASYINEKSTHNAKVVDLSYFIKNNHIELNENLYKNCATYLYKHFPSKIYAFSTIVTGEIPSIQISKELKKIDNNIEIIFGNQWASLNDEKVLKEFEEIDYIIRGEGEETLKNLLDTIEKKGNLFSVKGISYKKNGVFLKNNDMYFIKNLDTLPQLNFNCGYPSYKSYSKSIYGGNYGLLEFGRGCPFSCTFCSTSIHWRRSVRTFSIDRTILDMKRLKSLGFDFIEFTYDNFGTKRKEVIEFCKKLIQENLNLKWSIRCRLDFLDEEVIKYLKQSGCNSILIGLESGSESVIKEVGKNIDYLKSLETVKLLIQEKIKVCCSLVTGFPFETYDDVYKTLMLSCKLSLFGKLMDCQIHFVSPLPGTEDTKNAILKKKLSFSQNPLISPDFSRHLEWKPLFKQIDLNSENPRFLEDDNLIKKYPDLFSSYGYLENKKINANIYASLTTYGNLISKFFPGTLLILLEIFNNQRINFIPNFEEFCFKNGIKKIDLLNFKAIVDENLAENIQSGCLDENLLFFEIFQKYIASIKNKTEQLNNIFRYEKTLFNLSSKKRNTLFLNNNKEKIEHGDFIKSRVLVEEFDYNILNVIKNMKNDISNYKNQNLLNKEKLEKTYLLFHPIGIDNELHLEIKIYKVTKSLFDIFNLIKEKTNIDDFTNNKNPLKVKRLINFFNKNIKFLEVFE